MTFRLVLIDSAPQVNHFPHLGLGYLSSYVKQKAPFPMDVFICKSAPDLSEVLCHDPDLIGISAFTEHADIALKLASQIKAASDVPVVCGGYHFSFAEPHHSAFDAIVVGEGEQTLLELVCLYREKGRRSAPSDLVKIAGLRFYRDGKPVFTGRRSLIAPLDVIPFPDREALRLSDHLELASQNRLNKLLGKSGARTATMITGRGCPFSCSFCASPKLYDNVFRLHSAKYVSREVQHLVEEYGAEVIHFIDDIFTVNPPRLKELARLLERFEQKIVFSVLSRVDTFRTETAALLKKINVRHISFGVESGSDAVLSRNKHMGITKKIIRSSIALALDCGFSIDGSFMIGFPDESEAEVMETYDFACELYEMGLSKISVAIATPFPGTPWWNLVRQQMENLHDDFGRLQTKYYVPGRVLMTDRISPIRLHELYLKFWELRKEIDSYKT